MSLIYGEWNKQLLMLDQSLETKTKQKTCKYTNILFLKLQQSQACRLAGSLGELFHSNSGIPSLTFLMQRKLSPGLLIPSSPSSFM